MVHTDVIIIGAGPAGLTVASLLKGYHVIVLEARRRIGRPPHCAGIVSADTARLYPREAIAEYYDGLTLVTSYNVVDIKVRLVRLSRPLLEDILAADATASILLKKRVIDASIDGDSVSVVTEDGERYTGSILVDAEGASARLARGLGFSPCRTIVGVQAVVKTYRRVDAEQPIVFMRNNARVYYSWIIPVEHGRRLMIGAVSPDANTAYRHVRLITKRLDISRVIEWRAGLIPYGRPPLRLCLTRDKLHVCVVGDAACTTKATSGGGLYAIARSARCIRNYIENNTRCVEWRRLQRNLAKHYMLARLYYDTPLRRVFDAIVGLVAEARLVSYDELRLEGVTWRVSRFFVK